MNYVELVSQICDDGIAEVREAYSSVDQTEKREGAIRGFQDARETVKVIELGALLKRVREETLAARDREDVRYWFYRWRELQVEWTANVISAVLLSRSLPTIVTPTERGLRKAIEVLNRTPNETLELA